MALQYKNMCGLGYDSRVALWTADLMMTADPDPCLCGIRVPVPVFYVWQFSFSSCRGGPKKEEKSNT